MTIQDLRDKKLIIFESYRGSFVYGTYIEGVSDKDKCGVFIQPLEDVIGFKKYISQVQDEKGDCVYYEVGRFLELLSANNPNILEILNIPQEFIIYKHPVFDFILKEKDRFITKLCADSFGGYGVSQLKKAASQNKMMNWEKNKVSRKTPIDFCYVIDGYNTRPLKAFLEKNGYEQMFCGVVNVPNARDVFALFYDNKAHSCFAKSVSGTEKSLNKKRYKESGQTVGFGYKGLQKEGNSTNASVSNCLRLSSIPKGETPVCVFSYNQNGYTQHCMQYNMYQNWLKTRNIQRWVDVDAHGQKSEEKNSKIDGKNMLHCQRLVDMAVEIAEGKGVIVKRSNAKELIDIRNGKVNLDELTKVVNEKIIRMQELFKNSNIPNKVDGFFVNELLIEIRKNFYNI